MNITLLPLELINEIMFYCNDFEKIYLRTLSKSFYVELDEHIEERTINVNKALSFVKKRKYNEGLNHFSLINNRFYINFFIGKGANYWHYAMYGASEGGHMNLVLFFIEKGADNLDGAMYCASKGGHMNLVLFFIEKGAKNWNWAMYGASLRGHMDLVLFFIEKGANNWNYAMYGASEGGHMDLVLFSIEKGANDWNRALCYASEGGHEDIVKLLQCYVVA